MRTLYLSGRPLEAPYDLVTRAKTVDVMVPADAEIIIEGVILLDERIGEGPYGEFTWYYGLERPSPVMKVTAITHRRDAIFHHLFAAHPEHNRTGRLGRESVLYKRVKAAVPSVIDVAMPMSGICRFHAYVRIREEYDGAGKLAALAALASDPFVKLAVVVDEDVDIHNDAEVLWAIATRTQPDRSTFFVPESATSRLDPSSYSIWSRWEKDTMNTKWVIDATMPVEAPFEERADVPRDVWENMDLTEYLTEWETVAGGWFWSVESDGRLEVTVDTSRKALLWAAVTDLDVQIYKASVYKLRWDSPGVGLLLVGSEVRSPTSRTPELTIRRVQGRPLPPPAGLSSGTAASPAGEKRIERAKPSEGPSAAQV